MHPSDSVPPPSSSVLREAFHSLNANANALTHTDHSLGEFVTRESQSPRMDSFSNDHSHFFDFDAFHKDRSTLEQAYHRSLEEEPQAVYQGAESETIGTSDLPPEHRHVDETAGRHFQGNDDAYDRVGDYGNSAFIDAARRSYLSDRPLQSPLIESLSASDPLVDDVEGLLDLAALNTPEKWEVDEDSAQFLASIVALASGTDSDNLKYRIQPTLCSLKAEEPLLKTDPQMDMIRLFERNQVVVSTAGIEPFPLDVEKDESLEWSKTARELPAAMDCRIVTERLEVDFETMEYLKDIHKGPYIVLQEWLAQDRKRKSWSIPVSPPLLPLSPPFSPGRLPSPVAEMNLTSTPEDPSIRVAAELDKRLLDRDGNDMAHDAEEIFERSKSGCFAIDSSSDKPADSLSSPLKRKAKTLQDLKLSSPVLPDELVSSSAKKAKTTSFQDEVSLLIPQPLSEDSIDPLAAADEALVTLDAIIAPLAAPAIERLDHEQLNEFDTTLRVPVPHVDDIRPVPPWESYCDDLENVRDLDTQRKLLTEVRDDIIRAEKKWTGSSKVERDLLWTPFPSHLGRIKPEGDFDDGSCTRYLAELDFDNEVDVQNLLWKMDGLRLLDGDDGGEDDLSPADYESGEETSDMNHEEAFSTPLGASPSNKAFPLTTEKTSRGQHARSEPQPGSLSSRTGIDALIQRRKLEFERREKALDVKVTNDTNIPTSSHGGGCNLASTTSTSSPLQEPPYRSGLFNFAKLQGWSEVSKPVSPTSLPSNKAPSKSNAPIPVTDRLMLPPALPARIDLPAPQLDNPERHFPVVISTSTMKNRNFIRALSSQLPNLDIIERDYSAVDRSTRPPDREADITISPSTGILLSNLQKLKQRPLPGREATHLPIATQIARLSTRYEHLVVLVSDGRHTSTTLDASDTAVLADLITTTRLSTSTPTQVLFIPGSDADLARWAAATITRHHSPPDPGIPPRLSSLNDAESPQERFLRAAGLNVFAAQAVLRELRDAGGLAAFVTMHPAERMRRFAPLLGGRRRVLGRVNAALERRWVSASMMP